VNKEPEQNINLLHALEIFVVVAEQGSMTSAAAILDMTQSAISQQIHNLESSIGTSVFDRDLRPLRLTMAGSMMFERAKQLLLEAKDLRAVMRSAFSIPIPHLRIGVLASVAGSLVAPIVFDLLDRLCARTVSVWTGFGNDHQQSLLNRELDLILIADPLYGLAGLERHELFSEPFVLLVPPTVAAGNVSYADLVAALPLIRHSLRSPIGSQIEQHLRRMRVNAPPYVEFDSVDSIVAAVGMGRGWAISTPTLLLQGLRTTQEVSIRPLPFPRLSRSFALIARNAELGGLPADVARLVRRVMIDIVVPRVCSFAPFAQAQFEIPLPVDEASPRP
jgi:DNA-binding transcriptional LysR family regulator